MLTEEEEEEEEVASRSYPTLPPLTYLPPAVDSLPLIPDDGWDYSTTSTSTTTTTTTTDTTTTTTTTTTTSTTTTTTTTATTTTTNVNEDVGYGDVSGNVIDDGEVGDEDDKGPAQDDEHVHERPSNDLDFVLVEPVQQTQLNQMKT